MRSTHTIFVALLALATSVAVGCTRDEDKTRADAEVQPGQQADQAVGTQPGGQATPGQLTADGREFLLLAAQDGLLELEAARLAQTKAQTEPVREFARMMVEHHTRTNEELMRLGQGLGLEMPKALDANAHKKLDKLQGESGRDFDKEYMDMMVDEHRRIIGMFERQAGREEDAPVGGWASQTLPMLRNHLDQAKATEDRIDDVPSTAPPTDAVGARPEAGDAKTGTGDAKTGTGDAKTGTGDAKTGTGDTKTGTGDTVPRTDGPGSPDTTKEPGSAAGR
jgi:putative membrane protein